MKFIFFILLSTIIYAGNPIAIIKTNKGDITIKLLDKRAPLAVKNFIALSKKGYYNGLTFHRVIPGFMIQGGDPKGDGTGGKSIWGRPFKDEFHKTLNFSKPAMLAMANSGPKTNGSQFFITLSKTPWLYKKHTIFGYVLKGYGVVKNIGNSSAYKDKPREDQIINSIEIINN